MIGTWIARSRPLGVALACAAALGGCVGAWSTVTREAEVTAPAVSPEPRVSVRTENGSIEVRREARGDVLVRGVIRARTQERADQTRLVAEYAPDGVLLVTVGWPDGQRQRHEGCNLEVLLPAAGGVTAETSNGAIVLAGLGGDAVARTSNGRIDVQDQGGAVTAQTSNGAVLVARAGGPVDVRSSNGRIEVQAAPGSVAGETSNGAIEVALAPESPGPVRLRTSNGPITLDVGAGFTGELSLGTSNGSIRLPQDAPGVRVVSLEKRSARLIFGDGAESSSARTSNGGVTVRRLP